MPIPNENLLEAVQQIIYDGYTVSIGSAIRKTCYRG